MSLDPGIEKRLTMARWQTVDVVFANAATDETVVHGLDPVKPTDVRFHVVDANVPGVVYRGAKAAQNGYIVLRASVAGSYHMILFIESSIGNKVFNPLPKTP